MLQIQQGKTVCCPLPTVQWDTTRIQNWMACLPLPPALPQRPPQSRPCRVNEGNAAGPVLNGRQCPELLRLSASHDMFPMMSWSPYTPGTQTVSWYQQQWSSESYIYNSAEIKPSTCKADTVYPEPHPQSTYGFTTKVYVISYNNGFPQI